MVKVVYLPLDERPVNFIFPQQLAAITDLDMIVPDILFFGRKKQPADFNRMKEWLFHETKDAEYLIISIDMLVFGGIVPSRLHHLSKEECMKRLNVLDEIKKANPYLKIYGFNLIMRTPAYSSSEEEPDYYQLHGREIFRYGWLTDKMEREELDAEETQELEMIKNEKVPADILADFLGRREVNASINHKVIDLVKEDTLDLLIIPLDDNSKYGYTPKEQRKLIYRVEELNLFDRVSIYPGADEIGCTIFAKVFCEVKDYIPRIFVRYSSTKGPTIIPKYEDRSLNESIKSHITASGGILIDHSSDSDVILMVNSPAVGENEAAEQGSYKDRHSTYFSEVHLQEFVRVMEFYLKQQKFVALADVATCNGSDTALMKSISKKGLLKEISCYAGWNTSGNTIGTVNAHAMIASYYDQMDDRENLASKTFYYTRLVEDWGYQALVRQNVVNEDLPNFGATYFNLGNHQKEIQTIIENKLHDFVEKHLPNEAIELKHVVLPWDRMFELGFDLTIKNTTISSK
ncbi:hypothetical protein WQ54_10980 [Bacillus sp. SA1-12]|uniref:DUF4127 family protein n=1 Tax=Bacillus sp. SA1-12 TaxID=1455638 RepID=UPI000625BB3A|nr:DUF4127 family protein [Bacillus sp. SA1-12]KKI92097.1 hypothetical protein WQ54_10980 [Bacillus sp. SA1-12]